MSAIYSLYDQVAAHGNLPTEYVEKMLHPVPQAPVVDRIVYLVRQARGKTVLDLGASGPMAESLQRIAKEYHGADIRFNPAIKNFYKIDFDYPGEQLPDIDGLELVIAGEIIEHLSNAGHFLNLIHAAGAPVILTTPNAFSLAGFHQNQRGIESVNREHVAWYSYHTLKVLIERHRFKLVEWYWYNGKPLTAEGLIFKMEPIANGDD